MIPTDPLYSQQWHFSLIGNIQRIWDEYSGAGVRVLVVDDGVQYTHPDLAGNYVADHFVFDGTIYDPFPIASLDAHGTACAGLIAALANNGIGGVGVAWGAAVTGLNLIGDTQYEPEEVYFASLAHGVNFDISSNSWGESPVYQADDNLALPGSEDAQIHAIYGQMSQDGRGGLGTVIVQAAGNDAGNAQGEGISASRFSISVAAVLQSGEVTDYSNWGSCILVAAPKASVTTDLTGNQGYNNNTDSDPVDRDYTSTFGGTSAATPVVSGVVALMLEANPDLGWRDVQDILATSARLTGSAYGAPGTGFEEGAWMGLGNDGQWNGGDRAFHLSYGYGLVDAFAAVRMAEVWHLFKPAETSANEMGVTTSYAGAPVLIPPVGTFGVTEIALTVPDAIEIDHVEVTITITHSYASDLNIYLVAPDGSRVPLMLREGNGTLMDTGLVWTFGVDALRGYTSGGTWRLRIEDVAPGFSGEISAFALRFHGSPTSANDVHHFTEDFQALAAVEGARRTITDTNGGIDWLNLSAIAKNVSIGLGAGAKLRVDGVEWAEISPGGQQFENVVTGDGNDGVNGNALANELHGMRGNDTLRGFAGTDTLEGGDGDDWAIGGAGDDSLVGGRGNDVLNGLTENDRLVGNQGNDVLRGHFGNDTLFGGVGADTVNGMGDSDRVLGGAGNDLVLGGFGNDTLGGEAGNDTVDGGGGDDTIYSGDDNDLARGGGGADTIYGEAGNDTLNGEDQGDRLFGGIGTDVIRGEAGNDTLDGGLGNDTLTGGALHDVFVFGVAYGADRITDFEDNLDRLRLDDALWGGGLTAQQVVSTYAVAVSGNTVFTFGGGNILTVAGIADPNALVNDIQIF